MTAKSAKTAKSGDPLYHFTCAHGFTGISKTGILVPRVHPFMRHLGPLLWLTDLPSPTAESIGLTSERLTCDRLAYRYNIHTRAAIRWSDLSWRAARSIVDALEAYGDPERWWVVRRPLLASEFALDHTYNALTEVTA